MRTYITTQGDTFDIIAKKIYGNIKYIKDLITANDKYADIVVFSAGMDWKIVTN